MSWVIAFLGFAALIILHELGHFVAAKAVGMRVERFALFFPPLLGSIRRGETEYAIGLIPAGGYVKITGMNPAEEVPPEVAHRAYYRQPVWKRVVVIAAGPAVNIVIAFVLIWGLLVFQGQSNPTPTDTVGLVSKDSAAVGVLQKGDRLLAVDGVRGDTDKLRAQIGTHRCDGAQTDGCRAATPAALTIVRAGQQQTVSISPRYDAAAKRPLVGFSFDVDPNYDKQGPIQAVGGSVSQMWRVSRLTVEAVGKLFYSSEARKEVSGVVGSYEVTRQTVEASNVEQFVFVIALISLSLAIINLFPFLPLDGGHIFWAVAEKLRGRAISFSVMERASVVGFVLVALLFVVGLTNDIGRLQGDGFAIR